jgi:RNA polymerase sigma-70 factor (ECF subfamily)
LPTWRRRYFVVHVTDVGRATNWRNEVDSGGEAELARLMDAATAGDESAYREFLRQACLMIGKFVRRRATGSGIDADDIVQDTLLAVHLKRHTRRPDMPVTPWLYAIARYKLIDAFRRRGRRLETTIEEFTDVLAQPETESAMDWEIAHALETLSPGQRAVVTAISVDGRTPSEAANDLGMRESAVRVAFHRGLRAIAARVGRRQ